MKDAAPLTDVAIVVLSDEFFKSKWPMIELAIFTEDQRRRKSVLGCKELNIFPLFMGLSVEEFRNQERRHGWLNKWYELGATDSRIDVPKWKEALEVLGGINGIKYSDFRNEEEYIDSIVSAIFKLVPPDLKWEDAHVKGKLKLHQVEDDSEEDEEMAFPKVSRKLMLACESRSDSAISDSTSNEKVWEDWEDWVKSGNISAQPHGKAESLELLRASGNVVDILYQQRVFFGGLRFLRQRHYSFPASILSVMSRKCFVSCIHVRN